MQVSVEQPSAIQRCIKVVLPPDYTEAAEKKKLKELVKNARIDGFRKGKIPLHIIEQRFGESVRYDAVNDAINSSLIKAINDNELVVVGTPSIDNLNANKGESISYEATVEVYPDVQVQDLSSLEVENIEASVTDEDIDVMIEQLRKQHQHWHEVTDRPAAMEDKVVIDFKGTLDGEAFAGGEATDHSLTLGSNSMIAGFEDGIVGMSIGDEKTLELTFPEDYQAEDLQGKSTTFEVALTKIEHAHLPEVNEDFMKLFDVEDGIDAFREKIRENMQRDLANAVKSKLHQSVTDALVAAHPMDVPKAMLKEQVENDKRRMFQQFSGGQNNDFDFSSIPDEPFEEKAKDTVIAGLVLRQVIDEQAIDVDKERIKSFIADIASSYESPEEVEQYYYGDENLLNQVESQVLEEQVMEYIISQAKTVAVSFSYAEAIQPKQQ